MVPKYRQERSALDGRPAQKDESAESEPVQASLKKLRASETRYRRLFEAAQDGILLLHAETGEITDANPYLINLLGYPCNDIVGKKLWEIGPFVDREAARQAFERLQKDKYIRYEDLPLEAATGEKLRVEFISNMYLVDGKQVIQCNIRDITGRRQAEALRDASEERYRTLFDGSQDGIALADVATGTLLDCNAAMCRMVERDKAELIGQSQSILYSTGNLHTGEGSSFLVPRASDSTLPMVHELVSRSGKAIPVEIRAGHVQVEGRTCLLAVFRDITERMVVAQESKDLARFPAENPDPVLRVSQNGRIVYANPASDPLLRTWRTARDGYVPEDWHERVEACLLGSGARERQVDLVCEGRAYSVVVAPGACAGYVNLYAHDVTELRTAEAERETLLKRQLAVNRITLSLGGLTDLPSVFRVFHDEVRILLDADGFSISRYQKDAGVIMALFVIDEGVERDISMFPPIQLSPEGKGMQSLVLRTGKPLNVPNWIEREHTMQTVHHIASDGALAAPPEGERDEYTKSAILAPMMLQDEPVGVLQLQSNRPNAYSDDDAKLLAGLADAAAIAMHDVQLIEEVRRSLEGTIGALAGVTEIRDPYTAGHQRRVSQLACAIAERMGLAEKTVEGLRISALLHDIGKVSIPADILSKPGALTSNEFSLIRDHVRIGFNILHEIALPWPVADVVLQHHERLDGSGYPQGLKGEAILLEARILGVADVVEAMASHRPYRAALGIDAALEDIRENRGKLYDRGVVEACVQVFGDGFEFA